MEETKKIVYDLLAKYKEDYLSTNVKADIEVSEIYTEFLLCFLMNKRNGIGKIDQLVLNVNKANISLLGFMNKQNATKYGYAEIIKRTGKYVKLKITQKGINYFENIPNAERKVNATSAIFIKRINLYVLNLIRKFWSFVFVSANNKINAILESGIIKLVLFIITVLSFLLKDEIKDWFMIWWKK